MAKARIEHLLKLIESDLKHIQERTDDRRTAEKLEELRYQYASWDLDGYLKYYNEK